LYDIDRSAHLALPVFASVAEASDRQYHYVVVTTKALPDVLSTAVLAQNGLGVEEDLYAAAKEAFSSEPVIITGAVFLDASLTDTRDGLVQGTMVAHLLGLPRRVAYCACRKNSLPTSTKMMRVHQFLLKPKHRSIHSWI
jgi:hypothetical protein